MIADRLPIERREIAAPSGPELPGTSIERSRYHAGDAFRHLRTTSPFGD